MPHDDAVYDDDDGGDYCSLAVSSTSPQKPPTTYTRVNDFRTHWDSILGVGELYAKRIIHEYIWYLL